MEPDYFKGTPPISSICHLVEQAIVLENNYNGMLLQGDEVERRVQLWRDALEICGTNCELVCAESECGLCTLLMIPAVFFHGPPAHIHSLAHSAALKHRLSEALGHRYNHSFCCADIDERINLCHDALGFLKEHSNHILPVSTMASLGVALATRFGISAEQNDLQDSYMLLSSAVSLDPLEPYYLVNLGKVLLHKYLVSRSIEDLNESLSILRRAHGLRIGHSARGQICHLLAAATVLNDQHFGQQIEMSLEPLIELYKEVLIWQPPGHYSHFEGWDGLSIVRLKQFETNGNIDCLNHAINCSITACIMLNPQHPRAFRFSFNLSLALRKRYENLGNPADCELAIFHNRRALDLGPVAMRFIFLQALAALLVAAAEYSGKEEMLPEAVSLAREALECVQESLRFKVLLTLGHALITQASHFGDRDALNEGIDHLRHMLECCDEGTVYYMDGTLEASKALLQLYELDPSQYAHCLNEAVRILEDIGRQTIPEPSREEVLHWTAKAYRTRFCHYGLRDDLKLAHAADEHALDLRPAGHHLRYMSLAAVSENLALSHQLSAITGPEHFELERALHMQKQALKELKEGHPDHPRMTISLSKLLLTPCTPHMDCQKAFLLIVYTLRHLRGNVYRCVVDLIPVLKSIEADLASEKLTLDNFARSQLMDVYEALIDLLPRLASLDMTLPRRIQALAQARDLAARASSHAVELLRLDRAIEILEAGRAVFWAQHLRLRTSFDSLNSDTAKELREISRRLEVIAGSNIRSDLDDNLARARMEKDMIERRRFSARFDEIVKQVRSQPGMDRFLRNLDYMTLSLAAQRGPVVILQESWMCIISAPQTIPEVYPLREITTAWLERTVRTFHQLACASRSRLNLESRGARKQPINKIDSYVSNEHSILAELWRSIAQPLISALGLTKKKGRDRPRLFCCPTGMFSFLPIHAAGQYDGDQDSAILSDYCVVSYTPTLAALLSCQAQPTVACRGNVKVLLAAASEPFTSSALPAAREEADIISNILSTDSFISSTANGLPNSASNCVSTADEVLKLLPEATILHLACHGFQNAKNPLESGFIMQDRMMKVADLIPLNLPKARLAFLSACETAQGDMERPDEALHLAATMLYVGFKSVVGTMWSMGDVDGPIVGEMMYRKLFEDEGEVLDFDIVPYALDEAVKKLRDLGLEPSRWAPYIHIGM